jgi:16S rRNA (guanine1207-N2)-methyltransferase
MSAEALKTLFHPFDAGELPMPGKGARVVFLGAEPGFRLPGGWAASIHAVQGFRPSFLALERSGVTVTPSAEGDGYDMALVLAGRHRGENELRLAEAISRVKPLGLVVMAGHSTDGVGSFRSRLEKGDTRMADAIARTSPGGVLVNGESGPRRFGPFRLPVPLEGHLSKHHGVVFWLRRKAEAEAFAATIKEWHGSWPLIEGRFATAPGMFSHDRVDAGSRLLAANLPGDISGNVADFCAGWGYLAAELARRENVRSIDLHEADFASIEAAKRNLRDEAERMPVGFHWRDLAAEPISERYDAIVMNPPFHQGRAADPGIGRAMIGAAAKALRRGGRLFMVANRQLPYEDTLEAEFGKWCEVARDGGFKVLAATR